MLWTMYPLLAGRGQLDVGRWCLGIGFWVCQCFLCMHTYYVSCPSVSLCLLSYNMHGLIADEAGIEGSFAWVQQVGFMESFNRPISHSKVLFS